MQCGKIKQVKWLGGSGVGNMILCWIFRADLPDTWEREKTEPCGVEHVESGERASNKDKKNYRSPEAGACLVFLRKDRMAHCDWKRIRGGRVEVEVQEGAESCRPCRAWEEHLGGREPLQVFISSFNVQSKVSFYKPQILHLWFPPLMRCKTMGIFEQSNKTQFSSKRFLWQ